MPRDFVAVLLFFKTAGEGAEKVRRLSVSFCFNRTLFDIITVASNVQTILRGPASREPPLVGGMEQEPIFCYTISSQCQHSLATQTSSTQDQEDLSPPCYAVNFQKHQNPPTRSFLPPLDSSVPIVLRSASLLLLGCGSR